MKNIASICLFFLLSQSSIAHEGGHFRGNNQIILNQWELKNGEKLLGNFSFYKDGLVHLEILNGKTISVPLIDFSKQDQLLLNAKLKKIAQFNQIPIQDHIQTPTPPSDPFFIYMTLACFLCIGIIYLIPADFYAMTFNSNVNFRHVMASLIICVFIIACSKKETPTPSNNNTSTSTIPKTRISFLDSAFQLFKPAISTSSDATYYFVSGSGMPAHGMMIGITSWQQQVPIPQAYTGTNSWSIPLQPSYATTPLSTKTNLMKGAVAIAINGIPIFNALNNRGEDSYAIGELDNWGGHCGRADDYHYHAAPSHLNETISKIPIAFALDGFAVYGSKEPSGNMMNTLDTCHGHVGDDGVYHYHGTTTYPYVVGAMKGKVNLDPATPAPENQILPQAFAKAARPATSPLKGAVITDFKNTGTNSYSLTYKIGSKLGYVNYSWDANNKFTYTLIDTAGISSTASYQR